MSHCSCLGCGCSINDCGPCGRDQRCGSHELMNYDLSVMSNNQNALEHSLGVREQMLEYV